MSNKTVDYIRKHISPFQPQTLIILGSGLGNLGEKLQEPISLNYQDIPDFPHSTVQGHGGRLICGRLGEREVLCMQGRFHLYEGHKPQTIHQLFAWFQELGIQELIVTNAAGSLNPDIAPGSLMLIKDHINLSGQNPLIGANDDKIGPRFPALNNAYDEEIRTRVKLLAKKHNIALSEGVYMMVLGPNFETPAEIRAFRILGADAVGMSTVPEVISAIHVGMKVLGISVITNYGAGMSAEQPSHEETLAQGQKASDELTKLISSYLSIKGAK